VSAVLQAIVFDFDGVIADSEPMHLKAFQQALAEEGLVLERDEYFSRYLGYDDVGMFQALSSDRGLAWSDRQITALVARKGVKLQSMLEGGEVLFPGAAAFIRAAAAEGANRNRIRSAAPRNHANCRVGRTRRSVRLHRRVRRHPAEQTVARPVFTGIRTAAAGDRTDARQGPVCRDSKTRFGDSNRHAEPGYAVWG
jgi:beta-phosphoglucomutase-like phosphatase (HAD superfamily)